MQYRLRESGGLMKGPAVKGGVLSLGWGALFFILASCATITPPLTQRTSESHWQSFYAWEASFSTSGAVEVAPLRIELLSLVDDPNWEKGVNRSDFVMFCVDQKSGSFEAIAYGDYPNWLIGWSLFWNRDWKKEEGIWKNKEGNLRLHLQKGRILISGGAENNGKKHKAIVQEISPSLLYDSYDYFIHDRNKIELQGQGSLRIPLPQTISLGGYVKKDLWSGEAYLSFTSLREASVGGTILKLSLPSLLSEVKLVTLNKKGFKVSPQESFLKIEGLVFSKEELRNAILKTLIKEEEE